MIKRVAPGVWKIAANSNIYLLQLDEFIIIDAGDKQFHDEIEKDIKTIIDPSEIRTVLLTHLHYDHTGNLDLFPNATIYAHPSAIRSYKESPFESVLGELPPLNLEPFPKDLHGLEIIHTPGHTMGSICIYCKEKNILFSGDTLFFHGMTGRTDLPTSVPEKLEQSLNELYQRDFEILCPGHDY